MTEDEWGPWIEHDGKGCPCAGQLVQSVSANGDVLTHTAHGILIPGSLPSIADLWDWSTCWCSHSFDHRVIRYRFRKPRAMAQIRALLENLPERVDV